MADFIHDNVIIGAGAAGLMAAYSACKSCISSEKKPDVIILEGKDTVGKKITATGNGKCNFTNSYQAEACYRSNDPQKAFGIVNKFDYHAVLELFSSIGIIARERNGYYYPYGEQAKAVRDVLKSKAESLGAVLVTEKRVTDIKYDKGSYKGHYTVICSDNTKYFAHNLIICAGGSAAPVFGTDGTMYGILKDMGLKVITPRPALCGLKIDHKSLRVIDGVRLKCNCSLFTGDKKNIIYSESGEIIFSKNGISGIPVMNLSRFAINEISYGSKCGLILDMFPETGENELADYINSIITDCKGKLGTFLSAIINDKMLKVMLRETGLDFDNDIGSLNPQNLKNGLKKLSALLKGYTVSITGDNGFENAQTTQGGVDLKEINENTMECKKYPGMYLAGEILDVDGMCGGYNLQWAWSTGYIAGSNV